MALAAHEGWPIRLVDEAVLTAPTFTRELHFLSDVRVLARQGVGVVHGEFLLNIGLHAGS